jgi:hypothetical protein
MNPIQLNRNDDDYALISYVAAYCLQTSTTYMGHIHKVKRPVKDEKSSLPYHYVLSFEHVDFNLKEELENLNDLIRNFEARSRVRGLIPLIDPSLWMLNTNEH